jgi:hypothetical protein
MPLYSKLAMGTNLSQIAQTDSVRDPIILGLSQNLCLVS